MFLFEPFVGLVLSFTQQVLPLPPVCQALGHTQHGRQYTIWPGSRLRGATFLVVLSLKVSSTLVERELGVLDSKRSSDTQHLGLLGQVIPDPDLSFIKQDNLYPASQWDFFKTLFTLYWSIID